MLLQRSNDLTVRIITLPRVMLFVATIALVVGVNQERRNLIVLGSALVAWMAWALATRPRFDRVRVGRVHNERVFEGESVRVTLTLDPAGALAPCSFVEVCDEFPPGDGFYVRALVDELFAGGAAARLAFRARCTRRRGLYILGPLHVGGADPTGLFESTASLDLFTNLAVYPRAAILERFAPYDTFVIRHVGERSYPLPGLSQEFLHVREYRHGDSPRLIHWPVSARHRKLHVKAFEDNVLTEVMLFLDLFKLSHAGYGDVTSEEALIAAAATLATRAVEDTHRVGLVAFCERPIVIPPGMGTRHLYQLLDALTLARSSGRGDFAASVREQIHRVRPGGTVAIVLAASSATAALDRLVEEIHLRGSRVAAVLIDDRTYHPVTFEQQVHRSVARAAADVARGLAAAGADVFTLAKGSSVRETLELAR